MVVFVLEHASEKMRGVFSRWMIEPKPGVFVGSINAIHTWLLRRMEKLWDMLPEFHPKGALMIYSCNTEQGFQVRMAGELSRSVIDLDGIQLIKIQ